MQAGCRRGAGPEVVPCGARESESDGVCGVCKWDRKMGGVQVAVATIAGLEVCTFATGVLCMYVCMHACNVFESVCV